MHGATVGSYASPSDRLSVCPSVQVTRKKSLVKRALEKVTGKKFIFQQLLYLGSWNLVRRLTWMTLSLTPRVKVKATRLNKNAILGVILPSYR